MLSHPETRTCRPADSLCCSCRRLCIQISSRISDLTLLLSSADRTHFGISVEISTLCRNAHATPRHMQEEVSCGFLRGQPKTWLRHSCQLNTRARAKRPNVTSTSVCIATENAAYRLSEGRIVQHARSGCFHCKNHLIEQNASRLQAFVGRIMWSSPDRDDVFQQTITNALRRFEQYRGNSAFLTWLCEIALNEMRQVIRKQRRGRFISIDQETHELPLASQAPSCFDTHRELETQKIVYEAVRKLPPTLRAVVELRFVNDLSLFDTAKLLGLSLPAVKSRCFRAKKLLAKTRMLRTAGNEFGVSVIDN